jgi:hypothetical protein
MPRARRFSASLTSFSFLAPEIPLLKDNLRLGTMFVRIGFVASIALAACCVSACHDVERHDTASTSSSVTTSTTATPPMTSRASPSEAPQVRAALCEEVCARSAPLHCKEAAKCNQRCRDMNELPVCGAQIAAAFACFVKLPTSDWECDEDGAPAVKEGRCESEQAAVAACLEAAQVKP